MAQQAASATELQPLVAAQGATRAALTVQAVSLATKHAKDFNGWYDTKKITAWAAELATSIEAILRVLAGATDAYAARSVTNVSPTRFRPIGRINVNDLRTGITHAGAFARAADAYRYQQSQLDLFARTLGAADVRTVQPPNLIDPLTAAVNRVAAVAEQDSSLVVQQQTQATFRAAESRGLITGWTRVIHPELSKSGTCGLCVAASTRIYRVEDLMPIHGECKCVPAAVYRDLAPGLDLNDEDLKRLYTDAGSTAAEDLKRTRYRIDQHGNLGPVLVAEGAPKRTVQRLNRGQADRAPKTPEQIRANLTRLLDQQRQILPTAASLHAADPKKWGDYFHKLEARVTDLEQQLTS